MSCIFSPCINVIVNRLRFVNIRARQPLHARQLSLRARQPLHAGQPLRAGQLSLHARQLSLRGRLVARGNPFFDGMFLCCDKSFDGMRKGGFMNDDDSNASLYDREDPPRKRRTFWTGRERARAWRYGEGDPELLRCIAALVKLGEDTVRRG